MIIHEDDIKGILAPPPHKRILKMLVSPDIVNNKYLSVGLSIIEPNNSSNPHVHENEEEVFYVVEGKGEIMLANEMFKIKPGSTVYVKPGTLHQLINTDNKTLKVLWTESPPHKIDDLYKIHKIPR